MNKNTILIPIARFLGLFAATPFFFSWDEGMEREVETLATYLDVTLGAILGRVDWELLQARFDQYEEFVHVARQRNGATDATAYDGIRVKLRELGAKMTTVTRDWNTYRSERRRALFQIYFSERLALTTRLARLVDLSEAGYAAEEREFFFSQRLRQFQNERYNVGSAYVRVALDAMKPELVQRAALLAVTEAPLDLAEVARLDTVLRAHMALVSDAGNRRVYERIQALVAEERTAAIEQLRALIARDGAQANLANLFEEVVVPPDVIVVMDDDEEEARHRRRNRIDARIALLYTQLVDATANKLQDDVVDINLRILQLREYLK